MSPGIFIPAIVAVFVAVWIVGQVLQFQLAQGADLTYRAHGLRFKHKPPMGVAPLVAKLIVVDKFVDEQTNLTDPEKQRMKSFIVEVFQVGDDIESAFNHTHDPEVNGTIDRRTFLLGLKGQDIIMVRQLADPANIAVFHEFAYHLYPFILTKDADPKHRPEFKWIEARLLEIERGS